MSVMNIYSQKDSNIRKTWLLLASFLIFIIAVGWVFRYVYANQFILIFAVVFSLVMNFLSYWHSDKIALAINKAERVERKNATELYNVIENLAITAGLPMPKVYLVRDPAPNAFATGRNPEKAALAVTTGLLDALDRSELEGVIAHELAHVGNRDILLSTVAVVLAGFIALLSDIFLRSLWWRGSGNDDRRGAGGVLILIGIVLAVLSPIAATLIRLAISRNREFLADSSGAMLTRYPEGLASALEKISKYSKPMLSASNATAHLWISDPHGRKIGMMAKMFMTHPPIDERITRLRGLKV